MKKYQKALKFWWEFTAPVLLQRPYFLVALFVMVATAVIEPYVYKLIIDQLALLIGDQAFEFGTMIAYFAIWAGISVIALLFYSWYRISLSRRAIWIERNYALYMFDQFLKLDIAEHISKKSGDSLKKIDRGVDALWHLNSMFFFDMIPNWLTAFAVLLIAFIVSWQLTLATLLTVPLYFLVFVYGTKHNYKASKLAGKYSSQAFGRAYDAATNMLSVKGFAREMYENAKYSNLTHSAYQRWEKTSVNWGYFNVAAYLLYVMSRFIIFLTGVLLIYYEMISFGTLFMFLAFSNSIYSPIRMLGEQMNGLQRATTNLNLARIELSKRPKIVDEANARDLRVSKGKVSFKNIEFSYGKKRKVLKKVSFQMASKKITALVGHSGAGKTTVTNLLTRFYDLNEGKITIDGQDISKVTLKSLRENIGVVMQDNTMFNTTIYNNIRYGNLKATRAQVEKAAKMANIHDFIMEQPKGYKTVIGERGLKLSGGEKQRVAIARVILKDPAILILDEATSSLDSRNEKIIQEALQHVMKGRTTLVIAHRLSTVRHADQIVVLDKGRVVEKGTHASLMRRGGVYRDLVDLQVGGFLGK